MKKNYNVSVGETFFVVAGRNLKEAKANAQFNKRMNKWKGKTTVKLRN